MLTLPPEFANPLSRLLNTNLLKHAAGTAIFCESCDHVMDYRRTVLVTLELRGGTRSKTVCCSCWDDAKPRMEAIAAQHGATLDVVDARDVLKREPRKPSSRR